MRYLLLPDILLVHGSDLCVVGQGVRYTVPYRSMQQGDMQTIFSETFTTYSDAIFRFCMVKVSNVELAEDMTQEVFTRYWQYLRAEKEMTNTRALLYTIANNLAKDWYKKKKPVALDDQLEAGQLPVKSSASPEVVAAYQEVLDAMRDMEDRDKEVLLLKYVEGLTPQDIAEVIGETANVVSVRINRATKRLQARLHIHI